MWKNETEMFEIMKEKYVESYLCTSKIQSHIEKTYHYELNDEEVAYLEELYVPHPLKGPIIKN